MWVLLLSAAGAARPPQEVPQTQRRSLVEAFRTSPFAAAFGELCFRCFRVFQENEYIRKLDICLKNAAGTLPSLHHTRSMQ